jgi:zinc protease
MRYRLHELLQQRLPAVRLPRLEFLGSFGGWRGFALPDAGNPLCAVELVFPVGWAAAPEDGIPLLTARLLLRGTRRRTASQFHRELEGLGAELHVQVQRQYTRLGAVCLQEVFPAVWELLRECVLEPALEESEFERERQRQRAGLLHWLQEPESVVHYGFWQCLAPGHPYAGLRWGQPERLQKLTVEECRQWYERLRRTVPAYAFCAGGLPAERFAAAVEELALAAPSEMSPPPEFPPVCAPRERVLGIVPKEEAAQSVLLIGQLLPGALEPDFPALYLVGMVLGGHFLARLNRLLRERFGMTYGIGSRVELLPGQALLQVEGALDTARLRTGLEQILQEFERLGQEPIPGEELARAVRVLHGALLRQSATPIAALNLLSGAVLAQLPADYYEQLLQRVQGLEPEELFGVQRRWMSSQHLVVAVCGEPDAVAAQLEGLGQVRRIALPGAEELY